MELEEQAFLEELFSLRRDAWECNAMGDFFSPACAALDCFQERHQATVSVLPTFTATYEQPAAPGFDCLSEVYGNAAFSPNAGAGDYGSEMGFLDVIQPKVPLVEGGLGVCKVEPGLVEGGGGFNAGAVPAPAPASKKKRVEGMPSKNLMAERRRRKRLNDRLSMLRSVVPKISKVLDGQDIDSWGHDRLHEGAAGEDQAAAGGDGAAADAGRAQRVPGAQPQRDARQEHPQVRRGEEGRRRHPGGDVLRGEAGAAAVDGEHARDAGARHPAVRRQLLQRLRHARLLLRDAEGEDQRGRDKAGAVQERRLRRWLLVESRRGTEEESK